MGYHTYSQSDFHYDIARGEFSPYTVVHKFGYNEAVGTTFEPITVGGIYRTPQSTSATTLRIKAGNANDTAAGSGARAVTLVGINASGAEITETLATAGTSASSNTTNSFMRLYRAYVSASGTYATATAGSHSAAIVIENSAGTETWGTIDATDFPKGQTNIGAYTVPTGYRAFIKNIHIYVEAAKPGTIIFFHRANILETAAPYTAMREAYTAVGVDGEDTITYDAPLGPYAASTDIGFMGKVASGTAAMSVNFDIYLEAI